MNALPDIPKPNLQTLVRHIFDRRRPIFLRARYSDDLHKPDFDREIGRPPNHP